ncbi:hypothetical protein L7F22_069147 [Adiantum nelumboides]|nr:hypothetical protein [Adiantum nelumboides]
MGSCVHSFLCLQSNYTYGLAATHEAWNSQILGLVGSTTTNEEDGSMEKFSMPLADCQSLCDFASLEESQDKEDIGRMSRDDIHVCAFDNRGVGKSSTPKKKSEYTTKIMALDALDLMDHLGWRKAHVFGHSLGAMIACKLAAMFPDRVASLALLSATGGGYECIPKLNWVLVSLMYRFFKAKSPEERALVDLDTHYTKDYLDEMAGEFSRRQLLYKEYVKNISASGLQNTHGQKGQMNACWTHQVSSEDYERLRTSSILISVVHGRSDVIAQIQHARAIARKLYPAARLLELPGGHLITHQHTKEVNQELLELIQATCTNLPNTQWQKDLVIHEDEENDDKDDGDCMRGLYRWLTCKGGSLSREKTMRLPYNQAAVTSIEFRLIGFIFRPYLLPSMTCRCNHLNSVTAAQWKRCYYLGQIEGK